MGKNVWVSPSSDGWSVKQEGEQKEITTFKTKAEAEQFGKAIAKANHSELISQKRNGQIGSKDSYGKDPCPPRDREH